MTDKIIGPFVDRNLDNPDMVWVALERRLVDLEEKIKPGPSPQPPGIGDGLMVVGNTLMVNTAGTVTSGSTLPASSASLSKEFEKAETILNAI